jgi:hypothetical protein
VPYLHVAVDLDASLLKGAPADQGEEQACCRAVQAHGRRAVGGAVAPVDPGVGTADPPLGARVGSTHGQGLPDGDRRGSRGG